MAEHLEDCHRSAKIVSPSLSYGTHSKAQVEGEGGGPAGRAESWSCCAQCTATTSCESAQQRSGQKDNPYPFHQILTEDAAVVPPETLGDGPDVLVWVGGGPARWGQKASASRRNWQRQQLLPPDPPGEGVGGKNSTP